MSKFLALLRYLALYLLITLTGGAIGAWWSIRSVSEAWGGDGIGVLIFGFLGILVGAMVGVNSKFSGSGLTSSCSGVDAHPALSVAVPLSAAVLVAAIRRRCSVRPSSLERKAVARRSRESSRPVLAWCASVERDAVLVGATDRARRAMFAEQRGLVVQKARVDEHLWKD